MGNKPREWWVSTASDIVIDEPPWPGWPKDDEINPAWIHVIEKYPDIIRVGLYEILIDPEDYAFLMRFRWSVGADKQTFYAKTNITVSGRKTSMSMHRLICGMVSSDIDHKDRNGLNNRKGNLRFATKAENSRNRVRYNSTGFRGVYKISGSTWGAQIQIGQQKIHKSGFSSPEEAAREYDRLSMEHHGEFGIRNFKY